MIRFVSYVCRTALVVAVVAPPTLAQQDVVSLPPRYDSSAGAAILSRPVTVDLKRVSLRHAIDAIAASAHVAVQYRESALVPYKQPVTVYALNNPLRDVLDQALRGTQLMVRVLPGARLGIEVAPGEAAITAAGVIVGQVIDDRTQQGLGGATLQVEGTSLGTVARDDGSYRIANVPVGAHVVVARRIGYTPARQTVTVAADQSVTVDFSLAASPTGLDAVVVTGTAGNQTRVAQSAVVATIDAGDVVDKAPVANVTEVLSSRVPGVVISNSAGTSGTASRINIRGAASISLSNDPLVFVDGVRVNGGQRAAFLDQKTTPWQTVSALNEINPDDIQSIEVVKGPAAATLYGADASAGVIQIITKKGHMGARHFTQKVSAEYDNIDPNFTPFTNYTTCAGSNMTQPGCVGKASGTVISFNPLVYNHAFSDGHMAQLNYSAQGGDRNYSYFVSGSGDNEQGTTRNNLVKHRSTRGNLTWAATDKLSLDASVGVSWNDYKLPVGDQNTSYGYLASAALVDPSTATVNPDGTVSGGWVVGGVNAISSILNEDNTVRSSPTIQLHYDPSTWFTNRLTLGADLSSTKTTTFYPRSDSGWYNNIETGANLGLVLAQNTNMNIYTADYLGNIKTSFFGHENITSNFSVGSQFINTVVNDFGGSGMGITTNANDLISSTTQPVGSQSYSQSKQYGIFAQEQLGFSEKLFLQAAARVDKFSSLGANSPSFLLPKVGVSYLISQEGFWDHLKSVIPTLRLRAAYGTTGRAPLPGTSLTTFSRLAYITDDGDVQPGVAPGSPGNQKLKAERGKELEMGFDADLLNQRASIGLTYYHKLTSDLLLQSPLAPSRGFPTSPFTNLGKVLNSGFEFTLRVTPIDRDNITWDANFSGSTLHNEILDLGNIPRISSYFREFVEGRQLGAWFAQKVVSVDAANNKAFVTDTAVYLGNQLPTFQGNLSSTLTLFKNFRVYALFNTKRNFKVWNVGQQTSERDAPYGANVNLPAGQGGYTAAQRLRYLGPYYSATTGQPVSSDGVADPYIEDGTFVRFQELSLTYTLPKSLSGMLHASGASITVGGRNLHLWKSKDYGGYDPEVLGTGPGTVDGRLYSSGYIQFLNTDLWTVPPTQRWLARINLEF